MRLKSEGGEWFAQRQKSTRLFGSEGSWVLKERVEVRFSGATECGRSGGVGRCGEKRSAGRDWRVPRRSEMWSVWAWVGAGSGPTDARRRPGAWRAARHG